MAASRKAVAINLLTISRIVLVLIGFLYPTNVCFFIISVWAAASDFLDGFLARRWQLSSKLGGQLDQIADKICHFGVFFYLLQTGKIHLLFVVLFLARELIIMILRHFDISKKTSNRLGKIKTFLAYTFIVCILGSAVFFPENDLSSVAVFTIFEVIILIVSYWSLIASMKFTFVKTK